MLSYCQYHQMIPFGTQKMMMVTMMTDNLKQVNITLVSTLYLYLGFKCIQCKKFLLGALPKLLLLVFYLSVYTE